MSSDKPTILIVEDDLSTLELYSQVLQDEYLILGTVNKDKALELAQQGKIQAVILEPAMSDHYGWELITNMRQALHNKSTPIILCSSLDERRRGMELEVAAYLVKPVMPTELRDVIQRILTSSSKNRSV
jgi:DNA-binding response OmpR family regulator